MSKTATVGLRLEPEIKKALEAAADRDMRSVSSMAEKILADWLRVNRFLK